ncbi:MAG: HEAT repeat domain-containing protein [Verrucomicrobia bacterium]|nr:HEAT repeat domain-containing protein [Verrucomicrobiota bacterium]
MKASVLLFCLCASLSPLSSYTEETSYDRSSQKRQILYLAQTQDCKESIRLYNLYKEQLGRHDFEILQKMAVSWIEQSSRSPVPERQILGIFGLGIAGLSPSSDILELAITSPEAQVQSAGLQLLGRIQEDFAEQLLNKAMSSPFFNTRLEAAFYLAQRKSKSATGQIESLMHRLPPPMRYFFPEFFAIIGTSEAISILRHLMDDAFHATKIEAILSAARHGRDDLLPPIRAAATHLDNAEQEASAAALGYLKDLKSIKKLKKLSSHSSISVGLAALNSLYLLGDNEAPKQIAEEAKKENLFAIGLLGNIKGQEETLVALLNNPNRQVQFNAAFSLLQQKDARCLPILFPFLIKDSKDLGFQPMTSVGGSMQAWKVISSLEQHAKDSFFDIQALTLAVKEHLLQKAALLPQSLFLDLVGALFKAKQNELVPILVSLLENLGTPEATSFLKTQSLKAGAPLIRAYCNLALFRMKQEGPYEEAVIAFIRQNSFQELIKFRSSLPWNMRLTDTYTLTPEESSSLVIGAYETLLNKQENLGIDLLLEAISSGHSHNRPVLAGILIHALQ